MDVLSETELLALVQSCEALTRPQSVLVDAEHLDGTIGFQGDFLNLILVEDQFLEHWALDVWELL